MLIRRTNSPARLAKPQKLMGSADLANILHSEKLPWAVRYALALQRLGCRTVLDYLFSMARTLWLQHAASTPETIAREEWAAWPHQG